MFFQDLPIALMQVCILNGWLNTPLLKEEPTTVYLTLFSAFTTLIVQMVQLRFEAKAGSESFTLLLLENMTSRINWFPFRKEVRLSSEAVFIDYGNIRGSYGFLTKMIGMHRKVSFQFSFKTLVILAEVFRAKGLTGLLKKKKGGESMKEYD